MTYGLATLKEGDKHVASLRVDGRYWPIAPCAAALGLSVPESVAAILDEWDDAMPKIDRIAEAAAGGTLDAAHARDSGAAQLLAPLRFPRKLIAIGANYGAHVAKAMKVMAALGYVMPDSPPDRPLYFMKPPTTTMVDPGGGIRIPDGCERFDWEIELAAVIGRRTSRVGPEEGLAAIMGYTVAIDFSARDFQIIPKSLFKFDMFAGKAIDTSCPVGPVIVPARFLDDPQDTRMILTVNDVEKQNASTAGMIHPLGVVISELSKLVTLEPGDIVLTGTPDGTGLESGEFLAPGDRVRATIEPIGTLEVRIA